MKSRPTVNVLKFKLLSLSIFWQAQLRSRLFYQMIGSIDYDLNTINQNEIEVLTYFLISKLYKIHNAKFDWSDDIFRLVMYEFSTIHHTV